MYAFRCICAFSRIHRHWTSDEGKTTRETTLACGSLFRVVKRRRNVFNSYKMWYFNLLDCVCGAEKVDLSRPLSGSPGQLRNVTPSGACLCYGTIWNR